MLLVQQRLQGLLAGVIGWVLVMLDDLISQNQGNKKVPNLRAREEKSTRLAILSLLFVFVFSLCHFSLFVQYKGAGWPTLDVPHFERS